MLGFEREKKQKHKKSLEADRDPAASIQLPLSCVESNRKGILKVKSGNRKVASFIS